MIPTKVNSNILSLDLIQIVKLTSIMPIAKSVMPSTKKELVLKGSGSNASRGLTFFFQMWAVLGFKTNILTLEFQMSAWPNWLCHLQEEILFL